MKFKNVAKISFALALSLGTGLAHAEDTIKIGVLHSLSGTMAISETTLKDTVLMLVDEQNKKGGVLGKKLEAVVVDPASDWPLFAEKARELVQKEKVSAIFGCWTSVSRKSVLPVVEELNSILFYPVQYDLVSFEEHALDRSSGSRAMAYVGILSRKTRELYWGAGIDVDIIRASVNALLTAVNHLAKAEVLDSNE